MTVAQAELQTLPQGVQTLLDRVPTRYLRDFALDLAWAALAAPRRPDALYQVLHEWEITLEEIDLAGDDLPGILEARNEAQAGVGLTPDELHAYLDIDDRECQKLVPFGPDDQASAPIRDLTDALALV